MVIISLNVVGSVEIVGLSGSMNEVVSTAFVVISNEEVVIFVKVVGSVAIVFSDSVEVIISVVVISSAEVPVVEWVWGSIEEVILID